MLCGFQCVRPKVFQTFESVDGPLRGSVASGRAVLGVAMDLALPETYTTKNNLHTISARGKSTSLVENFLRAPSRDARKDF